MNVDLPRPLRRTDQLDATRAVDEVEEDELSHVAARHDPARKTPLGRVVGRAGLELLGFGANARDLVAVGKPLGERHSRASLRAACPWTPSAPGPAEPASAEG